MRLHHFFNETSLIMNKIFTLWLSTALGLFWPDFLPPLRAGVDLFDLTQNPLPVRIRGFLLDHRQLRQLDLQPNASVISSPLQVRLQKEWQQLDLKKRTAQLSETDLVRWVGLQLRFHQAEKAVAELIPATRIYLKNVALRDHLVSAWFLLGDYRAALETARDLQPGWSGERKQLEELHLQLIRSRLKSPKSDYLDDLFGIDWTKPAAKPQLNTATFARLQQLCLWYPRDGKLLWQLGEHCYALGDVRSAAAILEGCVVEFGMRHPVLFEHRSQYRAEVEKLDNLPEEQHRQLKINIDFRSNRAFQPKIDPSQFPEIVADRPTLVPWFVFTETHFEKGIRPKVLDFTKKLDGQRIAISGFINATQRDREDDCLLTEFPIGCWFCETPGPEQLLRIQLQQVPAEGLPKGQLKVTGRLKLNLSNPETFLFLLEDATISAID